MYGLTGEGEGQRGFGIGYIYIYQVEFSVLVFFSAMDLLHLIFIVRLVNWNDKRGKIAGGRKFLKIKIFNRNEGNKGR